MSEYCVVKDCTSRNESGNSSQDPVNFHRFPEDESRKTMWTAALGHVSWHPSPKDVICSLHFQNSDFVLNSDGDVVNLSPDAIPSIMIDHGIKVSDSTCLDTTPDDDIMTLEDPDDDLTQNGLNEEKDSKADTQMSDLQNTLQINPSAPRETLLQQLNKCYMERMIMKKRYKLLRRKNVRGIQKITKAREKKLAKQVVEEAGPEVEVKKKKKSDHPSRILPKNLNEVLLHLEKQDFLSKKAIGLIRKFLNNAVNETVQPESKTEPGQDMLCSPAMKAFAKTLLFFSSEAYHNVKEVFDINIPMASVTRTWYNTGLGLPGWSSEAFLMLKDEIQKAEGQLHCCICMREYELTTGTLCDDGEVKGFVDYGTTGDLDQNFVENLPLAQSALFLMLAPLQPSKKWRIPLAYFLVDTLLPEERANILLECLWRVYNMGSVVLSVVVDASACSRQTIESLGICFEDLPYPCSSFPHPADGLLNVHVIFDPSHAIDLLRHTWASVAIMVDEKGGPINWKFFTELVKVQETQAGCSELADQTATWYWDKCLMRKRLISQLFSSDVASAIECCCSTIQLPQFSGCESTVYFILMVKQIYDIFKADINDGNVDAVIEWKKKIMEALNYLFVLRDRTGQGMFATNAKAPFVCLYFNLISFLELNKIISSDVLHLLNLDDLELMFLAVRSKIDWKESPRAGEFSNAYSLLLQEEGVALSLSLVRMDPYWWVDKFDVATARMGGREISRPVLKTENTPPLPRYMTFYPVLLSGELQRFRASQLVMVHTVKRVAEILNCSSCVLGLQMPYVQDNPTLILLRKTCGGFVYPSQGVIEVCALAEHHLKTEMKIASYEEKDEVFSHRNASLLRRVCLAVLQSIVDRSKNPFPHMEHNATEHSPNTDHVGRLIRAVTASYVLLKLQPNRAWYMQK